MKKNKEITAWEEDERKELLDLCERIRRLMTEGKTELCGLLVRQAMANYPDAPQPHNLYGILLEEKGDHPGAMKHFRAAWALDQGYEPAGRNMAGFGSFSKCGAAAYDERDCGSAVSVLVHRGRKELPPSSPVSRHTTSARRFISIGLET